MPRQQNVSAAQWTPNGGALGAPDLTSPDNQVFGANVFSPAVQRQRLPRDVFRRLSQTLARGEALDTSTADAVALGLDLADYVDQEFGRYVISADWTPPPMVPFWSDFL